MSIDKHLKPYNNITPTHMGREQAWTIYVDTHKKMEDFKRKDAKRQYASHQQASKLILNKSIKVDKVYSFESPYFR